MTTELDRLLEIERDIERNLIRGNASVLDFHKEEKQSLISQLESKLAQAEAGKCKFCQSSDLETMRCWITGFEETVTVNSCQNPKCRKWWIDTWGQSV